MLRVERVRLDYLENPVGTAGMPQFGWRIECDGRNVVQRAYQLVISEDESFQTCVYDSGWIDSGESAHVRAGDVDLKSCFRYFARVRVRCELQTGAARGGESVSREESPFSETVSFVTAILKPEEWKAGFITAESEADRDNSGSTCLRKRIPVKGQVESAYLCVTALGLYRFFINGKKVGQDELTPGWTSYTKHLCYQTYDVTEYLREGENTLGAMLGAGWYKGKMGFLHLRNNYGTRTALLAQMRIRYCDGRQETILTDDSWTGADGPVVFSEIYDGEIYDASLEMEGWNENGHALDGGGDCQGEGQRDRGWRTVSRVDFPMDALTAQAGCKVTVMEKLPALNVIQTPRGETVVDFGQNLTGWVRFRVHGALRGDEVLLKCFETLDAEGNVYTENLRTAKQEIRYKCGGRGEEEYHPFFTFMGFRYVQVLKFPERVRAENFKAYVLHSRMDQTGTFQCSDPLVNQLQHNILWSLKGNFLDIPTDCPQRDERVGWTGDAQIFCRTSCYLMNTYTFFEKWLRDVAADQTPEGGVPHVVPDIISGREEGDWLLSQGTHSAAAWADVAVINPWTMYLVFGDRRILEEQYESMKKWIDFMRSHAEDYIWNYKLQFGDWVALDAEEGSYFGATPNDLTCTAYYAYSTGLFVRAARVLGKEDVAAEYGELYGRIVDKFRRTFFDRDGGMTAQTQTAHIVALYFGLTPKALRAKTAGRLVELLRKENGHLVTGFVGTPYFCHALSQNGYTDEAYELLLKEDFPSWLYQVEAGATTIWEHWDGLKPDGTMWSPDMNSFNHYAYGAVGDWLYRVVLGLDVDEKDPGYHHFIVSPQTGDAFDYAQGTYESAYGEIKIRWEKWMDEKRRKLFVTVPHNTFADIRLEKGSRVLQAQGLAFAEEDGVWTARCGSGTWEVLYEKD